MEYSQVFDIVKFEKEKTVATFNLFHKIAKLRQIFEAVVVLGLVSWSTARVPAVARTATVYVVQLSTYLFNHHVVFLIGNSIIVLLFVLFRRNGAVHQAGASGGDLYDEYVKHGEAGLRGEAALPSPRETACRPPSEEVGGGGGGRAEEKQIVVSAEETVVIAQCNDVASAIEKAARQIERFQRTQSEKLRREIGARPQADLRRSESHNSWKSVSSGNQFGAAADMERLSSEEFRRTVDAFIDEHWSKKKKPKQNGFERYDQKYQLLEKGGIPVRNYGD
ncbi:hypothetical protein OROHE_001259 [Orobanche hederae]